MQEKRAYLDTCLVSALVKQDIGAAELEALERLIEMNRQGEVSLACSSVVEDELAKLPEHIAERHLRMLKRFQDLPKVRVGGVTRLGAAGIPTANPRRRLWERLRECLPDEPDAQHVFVAATNRFGFLVTVDRKTMLSRADAVRAACGVRLVSPTGMVAEVSGNAC